MPKEAKEAVKMMQGVSCIECPYFQDAIIGVKKMCGIALSVGQCYFEREGEREEHVKRLREWREDMERRGVW